MNIPEDVLWILQKLKDNGYPSYLVGGCVRDAYMGKEPKDWDITTPALPEQVKSIFRKTFDTGIQHGTVTVVVNKNNYEITTFRIDGIYEKHRKPKEVFFTSDIIEDLSRRDFTINAIAYAPQQEYIDPFDGIADIDQKVIRAVGNPEDRFFEDALRMLRAIRFSAQFNFVIERNTFAALQKHAALIQNISYERIREELIKTITAEFVDRMIVLKETKILWTILPGVEKSFDEALHYLKQYKGKKKSVCLAILLANIQEDVVPILKRLTFDNHIVKRTQTILKYKDIGILTNAQMKKIILTIGQEAFIDLIDFIYVYRPLIADELKQQYSFIRNDCVFIKDLQVDGNDLVQLGFQKGPEIGRILSQLLYYVHENPSLNERSILLEMALELLKKV